MENQILVVIFSKMEAYMKVTTMMLATIFTSIHVTYTFTFFICSNSFVVFGHWSFCLNVKLLQMIFTSMTLTKLIGISSTLSKLFLFWRWCMPQFLPHVSPMWDILQQQPTMYEAKGCIFLDVIVYIISNFFTTHL